MERHKVSIVKYGDNRENVRKALQMSGCMEKIGQLKPSDKVLVKPNLVIWDAVFPYPKFGVLTTSVVVEEVVKILVEAGCRNIVIGEGAVVDKSIGSSTENAFAGLGYDTLRQKYGVQLLDFNQGKFAKIDFGHYKLSISNDALDTDFIVNLPVLKTHGSTKVSLGFKNLKGALKKTSKSFCHHSDIPLDDFITAFGEKLYAGITLIDGIYTMERGPFFNGRAYRADLLVASPDMLAADIVGSEILGYPAESIDHLRDYAQSKGLPFDGSNIEIVGESLESVKKRLEWDWNWKEDDTGPIAMERMGITGLSFPKYDITICSGCSYLNNLLLIVVMGAYNGAPFENIEFLSGKKKLSAGGFDKTFLFGNCIIKANRDNPHIKEAVKMKGCPPTPDEIIKTLQDHGIQADMEAYLKYRRSIVAKYEGKAEFDETHFTVTPD